MIDPNILNDKTVEALGLTLGSMGAGAILAELGFRVGNWIDACFHRVRKTGRKYGHKTL